mmetsp:Transcript_3915/g.5106  ORF Transcript_3915/g.5106 Transcript_3915/m.5106 type:complete len:247 (+) Transcript_3915:738-1478(+)
MLFSVRLTVYTPVLSKALKSSFSPLALTSKPLAMSMSPLPREFTTVPSRRRRRTEAFVDASKGLSTFGSDGTSSPFRLKHLGMISSTAASAHSTFTMALGEYPCVSTEQHTRAARAFSTETAYPILIRSHTMRVPSAWTHTRRAPPCSSNNISPWAVMVTRCCVCGSTWVVEETSSMSYSSVRPQSMSTPPNLSSKVMSGLSALSKRAASSAAPSAPSAPSAALPSGFASSGGATTGFGGGTVKRP